MSLNSNTVNGLPNSHNSTSSASVNGVNSGAVHRTSSMNGQYMDTSPSGQYADQRDYVNGGSGYSSSQVRQVTVPYLNTSILRLQEGALCLEGMRVATACSFVPLCPMSTNLSACC